MSTKHLSASSSGHSDHSDSCPPNNYGARDQSESTPKDLEGRVVGLQGKERVWVVARCALIACLASVVVGMNGGFNSPALVELQNSSLTTPSQHFSNTSKLPSLFGVSRMTMNDLAQCWCLILPICMHDPMHCSSVRDL